MSRLHSLKVFVQQRLTAAVEDIFGHVERTISEYEEELVRQWKLTDTQQLLVNREVPEQQEWSPSVDPEPPHIKEEHEEVWTNQEGEQLQGLEEADVTVKSEDGEEPLTSSSARLMETEADEEDCGGSEPARNSDLDLHLESVREEKAVMNVSDEKETRKNNSGLNFLINSERDKSLVFSDCGEQFCQNSHLKTHERIHTGEKPFSCSICGKRFKQKLHLVHHMVHHTGQKLFSCTFCDETFTLLYQLENHMCVGESAQLHQTRPEPPTSSSAGLMKAGADGGSARKSGPDRHSGPGLGIKASHCSASETEVHVSDTGLKNSKNPFSFPESDTTFGPKTHVRCQTGEKPLSCLVSNKGFSWRRQLKRHMRVHTEENHSAEPVKETFICPECGRRFVCKSYLKGHMRIHSGEMRNSCSVCGKCFVLRSHLNEHMRSHTGERPFSCQVCKKSFRYSGNLGKHMKIHSREKLLSDGVTDTNS